MSESEMKLKKIEEATKILEYFEKKKLWNSQQK